MRFQKLLLMVVVSLLLVSSGMVNAAELKQQDWMIEGVTRQALVAVPDSAKQVPSPLVFVFHGHGGNMRQVARSFRIHELWDQAIVVYMQGLNTPGQLTDPEGKRPGWQKEKGDQKD